MQKFMILLKNSRKIFDFLQIRSILYAITQLRLHRLEA